MIIKSLIVGLGNIGMNYDYSNRQKYHTHCSAVSNHRYFNLSGAVDISKTQRIMFKKKYKKSAYSSFVKAVNIEKPDIIIISIPTLETNKIYKKIIEENMKFKAIFFEKPVNQKKNVVKKIFNYCLKNNIKIYVNYLRRFDISSRAVKKILIKKQIGEVKKVDIIYKKGFYNSCSHYINYLDYLFPKKKKIIYVRLLNKFFNDYLINFTLKSDITFNFKVAKNIKINESIKIIGSEGNIEYITEKGRIRLSNSNQSNKLIKNNYNKPLKGSYDNIYKTLNDKITPENSNIDALDTIDCLNNIIKKTNSS